ncbi:MAG: arsenate reductase ArsC [Phycisphaerae bacterium]|nr:arsenate reductase ArsC [Phycisphaerae bacterium]
MANSSNNSNSRGELVRIVFVCSGNSARSQMAEGFARAWSADNVWVESAGIRPIGLSEKAVQVMAEVGVDISRQHSKSVYDIDPDQDYVITLCDHAVDPCQTLAANRERAHWSAPDPVSLAPCMEDPLTAYRRSRDMIAEKVRSFLEERGLLKEAGGPKD